MASAFGFSVGDFISAALLIKRVSDALKTAGGAAEDYQHVVIELEGLDRALKAVAALNPNESNALHVNAIRGMALSCQLPLRQFLKRLQSYERSLGPFAPRNSASGAFRKAKWATSQEENIQVLRAVIAAKVTSINLLLNLQISESLSRIEPQVRNEQNNVLSEILKVREELASVGKSTQGKVKEQAQTLDVLQTEVENVSAQIQSFSDSITASQTSIKTSIITLRGVGEQIVDFVNSFPREIQHLLQRIFRTNVQIYHLLLHFQNNLSPNPSIMSDSNIFFEDALGRNRRLPFEWFQHWETFEGLLRAEFHGLPGEFKVTSGEYHLINRTNQTQVITKENWKETVFPGSSLVMSMIIKDVLMQHHLCPRPSCRRNLAFSSMTNGPAIVCPGCGLTCYLCKVPEIVDDFTVLESEEVRVEQRQIDEDYQIFGERPVPSDIMDTDEAIFDIQRVAPQKSIKTNMLPTLSAWGQVELDALLSGRKSTEIESQNSEDKRSKPTPLDAWLDQVSILSASEMGISSDEYGTIHNEDNETNALECFRHIHIDRAYDKRSVASDEPQNARNLREVSFNARIFYRNIRDKYPQMPEYLAKRLAKANERRAERLGLCRTSLVDLSDSTSESSEDSIDEFAPAIQSNSRDTLSSLLIRSLNSIKDDIESLGLETRRPQSEPRQLPQARLSAMATNQSGSKVKSYWSQTYRIPGPHSSASGSSTRHSSLHGSDSLQEYNQSHKSVRTFSTGKSPGSNNTHDVHEPLLSLPPPPVELGTQKSFTCDICSHQVEVLRRRDWKKHVFQDLEPYLCTFEDCPTPDKTYTTRRVLVSHEMKHHRKVSRTYACTTCTRTFSRKRDGRKHIHFDDCDLHQSKLPKLFFGGRSEWLFPRPQIKGISVKHELVEESSCPFCGQNIAGSRNALMQHLGRHMEVISFAVVSKPYEEWQFYEDSLSAKSSAPSMVLNQNICKAVTAGDFRLCENLLSAGANVNAIESGKSALYIACSEGHYAIAWLLLHKGANPELVEGERDPNLPTYAEPITALDEACSKGYTEIVSLLSRVVKKPTTLQRALIILVEKGNITAFQELFSAYQRLGLLETFSILLRAVEVGQVQIVQFLFARGVKPDSSNGHNTALLTAISNKERDINMILALLEFSLCIPEKCWRVAGNLGDRDIIVAFCEKQSSLARFNSSICTTAALNHCLAGAACKGDLDIINMLLGYGAEIQDEAIDCACRSGKPEVTLFLLKRGGKANSSHIKIASEGGFTSIVKHLVDFGAKPTLEALLVTIRGGHHSTFEFLHSNYPHLLGQDQGRGGTDAMETAYESGHSVIVIRLMELGVPLPGALANNLRESRMRLKRKAQWVEFTSDENSTWSRGDTELHRAATRGHHEIVQLLLDQGFDPNIEGSYQENPLHRACQYGKTEVVRVLLKAGANVNGTNGSKLRNPLGYCKSTEIRDILKAGGAISWAYANGGWEKL